ncbi:MAG TPA: peptidylprolyl isomerase [Rubricoccaceae bacterium]|jgi:peptidyl-prolyl cis-trans isomerase SurA
MRLSVLVFAALVAAPVLAQPVTPGTRLDGIAAVVGDQVVLYSEVDALSQQAATQQQTAVTPELWSRALDQLLDRRILIDNARRDTTVDVSDAQVSDEVERNVQQLVGQVGSQAALEEAYGRPLADIRESFREEVRDDLLLQQYRSRRLRDVAVTPGEVTEWFDRIPAAERPEVPELVRVAHVVRTPAPSEAARAQARQFAQALRDSIAAGQATLAEIANRHTSDPGNTNRDGTKNGGSYRNFATRDLDPTFVAASAALDPGGLSQVFETGFGYHVLRLDERVGDRISFSHVLVPITQAGSELDAARATLRSLRDSVVTHGVPFEAIARRHSQDPYSASRGGFVSDPRTGERDLRLDALGTLWKATVDTMAVGEISGVAPVQLLDQTDVLHFVLLQKRTPAHPLSLEADYALLAEYALQDKRQEVLREWVDDLKRSTYVDLRAGDRYVPASPTAAATGAGR